MKFISWNVNGLRACIKPKTDDDGNVVSKGFEAYFKELDADFFRSAAVLYYFDGTKRYYKFGVGFVPYDQLGDDD